QYNYSYSKITEQDFLKQEKFIKEKNFYYLNPNNLYITCDGIVVFLKKSTESEYVAFEYKKGLNTEKIISSYPLSTVNKLGYSLEYIKIILFIVKEIPSLNDKINLL